MSNLRKLLSGVSWGTVSIAVNTLLQLVFAAVMARLLDPAAFGLVAIAQVGLRFFSYFSQMGIAPALIQKPTLSEADIGAALTLALGVAGVFSLLAAGSAGFMEDFFGIDDLGGVMRILAFNFIVVGFSSVLLGFMRRQGHFKKLAIIEIISYVVGYGLIGIPAAYFGAGVWALVAAFMTQSLVTALGGIALAGIRVRLSHLAANRIHFFSYGGRYSIVGFIEFLTANLDALVIGKFIGVVPAGHYNRALLLANMPVQQPANVLSRALFPIMSSMSSQRQKQSISVQLSILLVGSYAFAVSAGISIAAPNIVKVLLGSKWHETIPILQVLVWSVGPIYVCHVANVALDSINKLKVRLLVEILTLAVMVCLIAIWAPSRGAIGIATALVIAQWFRFCVLSCLVIAIFEISLRDIMRSAVCITTITVVSGFSILAVSKMVPVSVPLIIQLLLDIVAGAFGLLTGFLIVRKPLLRHAAVKYLTDASSLAANVFGRPAGRY